MDEQVMRMFLKQILNAMECFEESIKTLLHQFEEAPMVPLENENKVITVESIRNLLMEKVKAGKTDKVREIFSIFGIEKLSDLKAEHYEEVYQMVQKI